MAASSVPVPLPAPVAAAGGVDAAAVAALRVGAHLTTPRGFYVHHGIYVGQGHVVHYAGWSRAWRRGPVERTSLERFADGRPVFVRRDGADRFAPDEVAARACSRIGEDRYRLASNNCEHFSTWCRTGVARSAQVERMVRPLRSIVSALRGRRARAGCAERSPVFAAPT